MSRARYDQLVDAGAFGPEDRIELLDGLLVAREPQGGRHAAVVGLVRVALERAFGRAYHVREEKPIALDERSEPEPDVVVVPGRLRDYVDAHPSRPVLVVEVAEKGKLPVPNFAAGGVATPADAALCMQLGAEAIFVGSGIFKSDDPENRARAIVKATTHWKDARALLEAEESLGSGMKGIEAASLPEEAQLQTRGW